MWDYEKATHRQSNDDIESKTKIFRKTSLSVLQTPACDGLFYPISPKNGHDNPGQGILPI